MSKRLEMLEKLTANGGADSFAWYALALEHKSLGHVEEAMRAFRALRERDPGYVPMYLMAATMLQGAGRDEEAREWLREGIERARGKGDAHAGSEMSEFLERLAAG
jgi:tetratricopeptide (TPR) repeat protein